MKIYNRYTNELILQLKNLQTDLVGKDLHNTNLTGVDLTGADLYNTNLSGANLTNANMTNANLTNVNLSNANLTNVNLTRADLTNTYLWNIIGNGKQIKSAHLGTYNIAYTVDRLQIGCENHAIQAWREFTDEQIMEMDGNKALQFWRQRKEYILDTINLLPAEN